MNHKEIKAVSEYKGQMQALVIALVKERDHAQENYQQSLKTIAQLSIKLEKAEQACQLPQQ